MYFQHENFRKYVEFMTMMYQEKLIYQEIFTEGDKQSDVFNQTNRLSMLLNTIAPGNGGDNWYTVNWSLEGPDGYAFHTQTRGAIHSTGNFIISCDCPRFQSGDAKGLVKESVRGDDIFIVVDPGNYSVTYKLFDNVNHMSPDDHFANLKRLIQAVAGKAHRVSVIMPSLYGGRQHRRVVRESLDCAVALQELQTMGVQNIITFDAHDPRVQNAVPLMSFDNAMPTYQVLKSLLKKDPEISFDKSKFTVVSPDEGAMNRNMYFSSVLGCNLGMFYKRRDYTRVVNGRNPIVAHEYLGESVEGKTVFIADDIIASGESMLEVASNLKERGAARIIANATFPLFTSGLAKFDQAVAEGKLTYVVGTNLTYRTPELLTRDWYVDVDVSKYAAYFVVALNHDMSVSSIIDPLKKIEALLAKRA